MTFTISRITKVSNKAKVPRLRFVLTTESVVDGLTLTETRDGCLAGVGSRGPWALPPSTPYRNYKWSPEFTDHVVKMLDDRKFFVGLDTPWKEESDGEEIVWQTK